MTLSDLQSQLPIASLFKWNFLYSCADLDEIFADIARYAVRP